MIFVTFEIPDEPEMPQYGMEQTNYYGSEVDIDEKMLKEAQKHTEEDWIESGEVMIHVLVQYSLEIAPVDKPSEDGPTEEILGTNTQVNIPDKERYYIDMTIFYLPLYLIIFLHLDTCIII